MLLVLFLSDAAYSWSKDNKNTYYDVLGLEPDCTLKDIKKAYRKLALLFHPDRVKENKEESTVKFREVSEAYEVLSDENSRAEYDRSLKYNNGRKQQSNNYQYHNEFKSRFRHNRDPFSQFNDLFQNDPFFSEAFEDMEKIFEDISKTFHENDKNRNARKSVESKRGFGGWLLDKAVDMLGVDLQVSTTSTTDKGTTFSHTSYGGSSSYSSGGTYTSKSTRTIIENGRRITVQTLEKNGIKIEERYEGENLVQRLIDGIPQNIEQIEGSDL